MRSRQCPRKNGRRIVLIARDKIRSDAILARLREYAPGIAHTVHFADLLRARAALSLGSPRIINRAHEGATLDFDDLQSATNFGGMKAYRRSKLCNILFTREVARRLRDNGASPPRRRNLGHFVSYAGNSPTAALCLRPSGADRSPRTPSIA